MTTSQQKAAEVIDELWDSSPDTVAQALADAGRPSRDLPEPEDVDRFPGSKCWQLAPYRSPLPSPHVAVRLTHDGRIKVNLTGEFDSPYNFVRQQTPCMPPQQAG